MDLIAANEKPVIGLFCVSILHVVVVAVVTVVVVVVVVVAVVVVVVDSSLSMRHLYTYYDFLKTTLRLFSNAFAKTKGSLSLSLSLSLSSSLFLTLSFKSLDHTFTLARFCSTPSQACFANTHTRMHTHAAFHSPHTHAHTFLHRHRSFLSLNTSGRNLSAEVYQCDSPPSTYPHLGPLSLSPFSFLALSPSRRCLAATGSRERADERARERLELTNDLGKNGDRFLLLSSTKTSCLCFSDFLKKVNFTGEEKKLQFFAESESKNCSTVQQCRSAATGSSSVTIKASKA